MTGMYINPLVIPELLLIMAMERYYKIKRETRYIAIAKDMRRDPRTKSCVLMTKDRPWPQQFSNNRKRKSSSRFPTLTALTR